MLESLFNKVTDPKETPTQLFFCEIGEIFKSTYFEEHLQANASVFPIVYRCDMKLKPSVMSPRVN